MRLSALLAAAVGGNLLVPVVPDSDRLWRHDPDFDSFIRKYNKQYKSDAEHEMRYYMFNKTRENIMNAMKKPSGFNYTAGVNAFADMSTEEFNSCMLCRPSSNKDRTSFQHGLDSTNIQHSYGNPPVSVDWQAAGAMGPVRDQGKCDACYAVHTAILAESRFKIQTRMNQVVPLSAQQLIDCSTDQGNTGCKGGTVTDSWIYISLHGLVKEKAYPYIGKDGQCKKDIVESKTAGCIAPADIKGWLGVPPLDELALRTAVSEGPIAAAVHASSAGFKNYKSGILTTRKCSEGNLNHMVTIVGYGSTPTGVQYWKILNSWGKSWGDNGYGYIQRNAPKNPAGPCGIMRDPDLYPVFRDGLTANACLS
ncbi:hypothetical protein FOL47_001776 [Perkinsus chesapeaki]|uniref:Cathepsin L n=1 Tax=Perkinsus chesapeaki TaxID=330153 RepID=A0A7J6MHL8_PERCH|nr:hypothetical protein FOL47_001776 [Perkinsus chesapeaki]